MESHQKSDFRNSSLCSEQKSGTHMQPVLYQILIRRTVDKTVKAAETFALADVSGSRNICQG